MGVLLGLDVGHEYVKAIYVDKDGNFKGVKFQSAVSYAELSLSNSGDLGEDGPIEFKGSSFLVGERAIETSLPNLDIQFLEEYSPLFAFKAIQIFQKEINEKVDGIAIGFPLAHFKAEKVETMKQLLSSFVANGEVIELDVVVLPQGYGTLLDYMFDEKGDLMTERRNKNLLVLDIGSSTVEVTYASKGKALKESSGTLENKGISKVVVGLQKIIQTEHFVDLPLHQVSKVLVEGNLTISGDKLSLSTVIHDLVDQYIEEVLNYIEMLWGSKFRSADAWVIGGGGAYILKNFMPAKYKSIVCFPNKPEFANVRGFLKSVTDCESNQ